MYCPSCGRAPSTEAKYCQTCGTNLHMVKQAINGELPTMPQQPLQIQLPEHLMPGNKRKKFRQIGFMVMAAGFLLTIVTAIIGGAISSALPFLDSLFGAITALCSLSFIFVGPMILIYGRMMYKKEDVPQVIVVQAGQQQFAQPIAQSNAQPLPQPVAQPVAQAAPPAASMFCNQGKSAQPVLPATPQSYNFESYQPRSVVDTTTNRLRWQQQIDQQQPVYTR